MPFHNMEEWMLSDTMEEWMLHVNSMMVASIGTSNVVELNRELTPILAELVTLAPGNDQHPAVKQLFTWLVNPLRTGEDFLYVTDSLGWHVYKSMEEHFFEHVYNGEAVERGGFTYLGKVVAEALAVKCPILKGSWEQVALSLVNHSTKYNTEDNGFISDRLGNWIIDVIGNADLCPNPNVQIQLMLNILGLVNIDNYNESKALESVMSACCGIKANYIMEFHNDNFLLADFFREIFNVLRSFKNEHYFQLDDQLS
ncbi:unnamed protein product [Meganyctiphanes norvegica]|uniref:Uncharacterized protein n=1 Tax=Meganyctiphanes norvegica TaxID=48144 RepID=A0AAV2R277_MEGNR